MINSYDKLIKLMRNQGAAYNPPSIEIGIVISEEPLIIKIGDLQLTKGNLLIADSLLKDYRRRTKLFPVLDSRDTNTPDVLEIEMRYTTGLKKDDILSCLSTADRQKYIVLARLVRV